MRDRRSTQRGVAQLYGDTRGLSTVEYAIILCLIAIVGFATWRTFGATVQEKVGRSNQTMEGLPTTSGGGS